MDPHLCEWPCLIHEMLVVVIMLFLIQLIARAQWQQLALAAATDATDGQLLVETRATEAVAASRTLASGRQLTGQEVMVHGGHTF